MDSQNFVNVFLTDFLVALGILNSKSVTVYYIMGKLEEVGFIKKKSNRYHIVNPKYIVKGNENKRRMIIKYFNTLNPYYNNDESTTKND